MEVTKPAGDATESPKPVTREPSPEVSVYLHLLILIHLIDKKNYKDVRPPHPVRARSLVTQHQAVDVANSLVKKVQPLTRRTMSTLAAKSYFYYSRAYELNGHLQDIRAYVAIPCALGCGSGLLTTRSATCSLRTGPPRCAMTTRCRPPC